MWGVLAENAFLVGTLCALLVGGTLYLCSARWPSCSQGVACTIIQCIHYHAQYVPRMWSWRWQRDTHRARESRCKAHTHMCELS